VIGDDTADDASLYVLGLLTPEEARKFQAMLAADPELAELVGRLETAAAALAWTAPPREPRTHRRPYPAGGGRTAQSSRSLPKPHGMGALGGGRLLRADHRRILLQAV
jgi:anti-sigma-K factor RskA